jgi:hypothetical protein
MFHKVVGYFFAAYTVYHLVQILRKEKMDFIPFIWGRFSLRMFAENLLWLGAVFGLASVLCDLPVLKWGWMRLLTGDGANIIFSPVKATGTSSVTTSLLSGAFLLALVAVTVTFWELLHPRFQATGPVF